MGVEQHADRRRKLWLHDVFRHPRKLHRVADARWNTQQALHHVEQSSKARTAPGQDASRAERFEHAALTEVIAQHVEELACARLQDFADEPLRDDARRLAGGTADLDFTARWHGGNDAIAEVDFQELGFFERDMQADGEVIG